MFKTLLLASLVSLIIGCQSVPSPSKKWDNSSSKIKVLCTLAMIEDVAAQIGGEYIQSLALIKGALDPHSYELVKGDDEKFIEADLILYNGLELEHSLSLRQQLEGNPKAVPISKKILETSPEKLLIIEGQYDPHIWMDIALWIEIIDPIAEAFCQKDPSHSDFFLEKAQQVKQAMAEKDREAYALMQSIPAEKRYLVTSHDAFNYFTRHYLAEPGETDWEARCAAPEGLAPEAQLSVHDLLAILSHVEKYNIHVLFPESNVSQDALKKIMRAAQEKGFQLQLCQEPLYGDSMGSAPSYLDMIGHNVTVINRAIRGES